MGYRVHNDDGNIIIPSFGKRSQWLPVELRSITPHNLKTGQLAVIVAISLTGTVTNGSAVVTNIPSTANLVTGPPWFHRNWDCFLPTPPSVRSTARPRSLCPLTQPARDRTPSSWPNSIPTTTLGNVPLVSATRIWVTGEYTVAVVASTLNYNAGLPAQYVNSTTEIPIYVSMTMASRRTAARSRMNMRLVSSQHFQTARSGAIFLIPRVTPVSRRLLKRSRPRSALPTMSRSSWATSNM